jgi:hypothetical protein
MKQLQYKFSPENQRYTVLLFAELRIGTLVDFNTIVEGNRNEKQSNKHRQDKTSRRKWTNISDHQDFTAEPYQPCI